jgi:hypothetical protein
MPDANKRGIVYNWPRWAVIFTVLDGQERQAEARETALAGARSRVEQLARPTGLGLCEGVGYWDSLGPMCTLKRSVCQ